MVERLAREPNPLTADPLDQLTDQERKLALKVAADRGQWIKLPAACVPASGDQPVLPPKPKPPEATQWQRASTQALVDWACHGTHDQKWNALGELAARVHARRLPQDLVHSLVTEALEVQADDHQEWYPGWGDIVNAARVLRLVPEATWKQYLAGGFRLKFSCPATATHASGLAYRVEPQPERLGANTPFATRIHEEWVISGTRADPYYRTGYSVVYCTGHTYAAGNTIDDGNPVFAALKPGSQTFELRYIIEVFDSEREAQDLDNFNALALKVFTFNAPFALLPDVAPTRPATAPSSIRPRGDSGPGGDVGTRSRRS